MSNDKIIIILLIFTMIISCLIIADIKITLNKEKPRVYTVNDMTIIIDPEVKIELDNIYDRAEVEIPVCLLGEESENNILIKQIMMPEIIQSNSTTSMYVSCMSEIKGLSVIGTIHNHPNGICALSPDDVNTYIGSSIRGEKIIGLKCLQGYYFYVISKVVGE